MFIADPIATATIAPKGFPQGIKAELWNPYDFDPWLYMWQVTCRDEELRSVVRMPSQGQNLQAECNV